MVKKISFFFIVSLMASAFLGFAGIGAEEVNKSIQGESYHNEKGLSHFKNGFYNFTPKHRKEEASKEYGLAIQEFNKALVINPGYTEAHRNLARVYYVQKKYLKAAKHYKKLTNLDPEDIDSYLYTASAYEKAQKYDEAIAELKIAKEKATDPQIIKKLDSFIEKIEQRRQ